MFNFQTWNQGLKAACTKFDSPMGRSSPWIPFWRKWRSSPKRVKSEKLWDYAKMPIEPANLVNVLLEHGGTYNNCFKKKDGYHVQWSKYKRSFLTFFYFFLRQISMCFCISWKLFIFHSVENWQFSYHSDFTWNQFLLVSEGQKLPFWPF